jgi:uncharacterized protein
MSLSLGDDMTTIQTYTTFSGFHRVAGGSLQANALAVHRALRAAPNSMVLVFSDATGKPTDVDISGGEQHIAARYAQLQEPAMQEQAQAALADDCDSGGQEPARSRGRPKLGVVAREVTLLPRHWEWLGAQPGGASVALRKLVEDARRANLDKDVLREAQSRAYHFMSAIAGDLPGFEEASRALFANDRSALHMQIAGWPGDVQAHVLWLAYGDRQGQVAGAATMV